MQVFRYESVESTNETAKRLIREPDFLGPAYVVAREQTAGKGTRGRKWASPKDAGIYLSVMETPHVDLQQLASGHGGATAAGDTRKSCSMYSSGGQPTILHLPQKATEGVERPRPITAFEPSAFTLAAGVACVECLRRLFGICVELKPINDLYANGGKLGGILTEAALEKGRLVALITGIGINVLRAERDVVDGKVVPISLAELLDPAAIVDWNLYALADAIAADVHALNMSVLQGDADRIAWAWQRYSAPRPSLKLS